jgi:serine/threonine protein phosphatase PrpC
MLLTRRAPEVDLNLGGWSGAGRRPANEDSYLIVDVSGRSGSLDGLRAFVAVSDGMGGYSHGDVASNTAMRTAESYLGGLLDMASAATLRVDPKVALTEIITQANQAVVASASAAGAVNMGATMTAAFVAHEHVWVGHVGDSRAYVFRGGVAQRLTTDHSRVGRMVAEGVITEAEGRSHPDRHLIDNALGFDAMSVELVDAQLGQSDAVLLCTDGVHSVLSASAILATASKTKDPSEAAHAVCRAALKAGSDDNVTAVVWATDWAAFRAAVPATVQAEAASESGGGVPKGVVWAAVSVLVVAAALGVGIWKLVSSGDDGVREGDNAGTVITRPGGTPVDEADGLTGMNATTIMTAPAVNGSGAGQSGGSGPVSSSSTSSSSTSSSSTSSSSTSSSSTSSSSTTVPTSP